MKDHSHGAIALVIVLLILTSLGCALISRATPTPTLSIEEAGDITPTVSPTAEVSPPEVTTEAGCTLRSAYVADVTVPDGTVFAPGAPFNKTWRLRNTGTCPWEAGTLLVFVSGDPLGGPDSVPVGAVAPGSTVDVSAGLVAPTEPGTYRGNWQLQAPDGTRFGAVIYVQIVVAVTPTPTRTPPPTVTPTAAPEEACVAPDPVLEPILEHAEDLGYDMGCPTAAAFSVYGAFQEFWANVDDPNPHTHYRSLMIWRSDRREIYVIVGEDTAASEGDLRAYTDFWDESQDEVHPDCAAMTPPTGYQLPIRGFGKIWCENELWEQVGWPLAHESEATLLMQPLQSGLLVRVTYPGGGYLIALDYRAVWAVTSMIGP